MSIFTVVKKGNFKCRMYEDHYETSAPDFITAINRKSRYSIIISQLIDEIGYLKRKLSKLKNKLREEKINEL